MSALEKHSTAVACDVFGVEAAPAELSGDWLDTITAIMAIVQQVMDSCPQSAKEKAAGIRKPTPRQKVAAFIITQRTARDLDLPPSRTSAVYKYLVARGGMLSEGDATALVEETANFDNLLI